MKSSISTIALLAIMPHLSRIGSQSRRKQNVYSNINGKDGFLRTVNGRTTRRFLESVTHLTLSNLNSQDISSILKYYKNLESLSIESCLRAHKIPKEIKYLKKLKKLKIKESGIRKLPDELSELPKLFFIGIYNCFSFTEIPDNIGSITSLWSLNVVNCGLASINDSIGNLENLQHLSLSQNHLQTMNENICRLQSLKTLDISKNNIEEIPNCIQNLESLEKIELYGNSLNSIPNELLHLPDLMYIGLNRQEWQRMAPFSNPNLKVEPSQIRYLIRRGFSAESISELIKYVDTTPASSIRRF